MQIEPQGSWPSLDIIEMKYWVRKRSESDRERERENKGSLTDYIYDINH